MGDLIDAILELSRLSRRRLVRVPVDISALASEVVAELQNDQPDRRVEVEIQNGLLDQADPALARTVLAEPARQRLQVHLQHGRRAGPLRRG